MGVISIAKVVIATKRTRIVSIQYGNREWVIVIKAVNSTG